MRFLRLRILSLLLVLGLVPLTLLLAGFCWLPAGFLSFVWFGLVTLVVTAFCVGASGYLARPVRDLAAAFEGMLRNGGAHAVRSRWVPAEFGRIQRSFSVYLKDVGRQLASAEAESRLLKQKLLDAERAVRRSCGIVQAVISATSDGVFVQDAAGRVLASNEALDTLLGAPAGEDSGRDGSRLLAGIGARLASVAAFEALISKAGEDSSHSGVIEAATTDVPPRELAIHTSPVMSPDASVIGRLWMVRDCTGQKRLAAQLQQAQKMEAIGQLAGGIAHDFNNLLTAIRGNLALAEISRSGKPDDMQEKLQGATRATLRAAELVKQLLGYSRKSAAVPKPADINKLVSEVENILRHSIDPRIAIHINAALDLWPALADTVHIEQVILNICLNARDALPESGGRIDITTANHRLDERSSPPPDVESGASEFVLIRVKDNGCGIPEELRPRIFEPFFSTKPPGKGTGLGLAMARDIVEAHGGWIEFDSEAGKGTEFRIYLPKAECATASTDEDEPPAPEAAGVADDSDARAHADDGRAHPARLLVVDDEEPVRAIAVTMLEHLGYEVTEARDGEEALDKVAAVATPFDAILLDVCMPRLSGRDTFKRLRADGCSVPVVFCSGFVLDPAEFAGEGGRDGESAAATGPVDVIQKPYSMEALSRTIAKAVAKGRQTVASESNSPA